MDVMLMPSNVLCTHCNAMYCTAVHVRVAKVISQEISEISVGKCLGNPLTRVTRSDTNSLQQDNDFRWKHRLRNYPEHREKNIS